MGVELSRACCAARERDLSCAELAEILVARYSTHPTGHEFPPTKVDMGAWLEGPAKPSQITSRELLGGLDTPPRFGIFLQSVLSRKECVHIIGKSESVGYGNLGGNGKSALGKAYRGNARVQLDDDQGRFGDKLWMRIKDYVPRYASPEEGGTYEFEGLNSRYRVAKYFEGEGFMGHFDKPTINEQDRCTIFTVNIYLNDLSADQQGRTRFFQSRMSKKPAEAVSCIAGSIAIFKQGDSSPYSAWHDGEKVKHGLKYLMRTDVVYKKLDHTES